MAALTWRDLATGQSVWALIRGKRLPGGQAWYPALIFTAPRPKTSTAVVEILNSKYEAGHVVTRLPMADLRLRNLKKKGADKPEEAAGAER